MNLPCQMRLWPEGRKPFTTGADIGLPTFTYYLPSEEYRTGQSVLILPGGGYGLVSTPKEGHRPAQFLASQGIASGVLEYRHAPSRHPVPLIDGQRAMRLLRDLANTNGLRTDLVGVMGFSAGGHLAGSIATQPEQKQGMIGDELDGVSCAADFAVLIYAVVSLVEPYSHFGSAKNLLGELHDTEIARALSVEKNVTSRTPPMFLAHLQGDTSVPCQNSLELYTALTRNGIPATLHIYEGEGHGFGLAANHPWGRDLTEWIKLRH